MRDTANVDAALLHIGDRTDGRRRAGYLRVIAQPLVADGLPLAGSIGNRQLDGRTVIGLRENAVFRRNTDAEIELAGHGTLVTVGGIVLRIAGIGDGRYAERIVARIRHVRGNVVLRCRAGIIGLPQRPFVRRGALVVELQQIGRADEGFGIRGSGVLRNGRNGAPPGKTIGNMVAEFVHCKISGRCQLGLYNRIGERRRRQRFIVFALGDGGPNVVASGIGEHIAHPGSGSGGDIVITAVFIGHAAALRVVAHGGRTSGLAVRPACPTGRQRRRIQQSDLRRVLRPIDRDKGGLLRRGGQPVIQPGGGHGASHRILAGREIQRQRVKAARLRLGGKAAGKPRLQFPQIGIAVAVRPDIVARPDIRRRLFVRRIRGCVAIAGRRALTAESQGNRGSSGGERERERDIVRAADHGVRRVGRADRRVGQSHTRRLAGRTIRDPGFDQIPRRGPQRGVQGQRGALPGDQDIGIMRGAVDKDLVDPVHGALAAGRDRIGGKFDSNDGRAESRRLPGAAVADVDGAGRQARVVFSSGLRDDGYGIGAGAQGPHGLQEAVAVRGGVPGSHGRRCGGRRRALSRRGAVQGEFVPGHGDLADTVYPGPGHGPRRIRAPRGSGRRKNGRIDRQRARRRCHRVIAAGIGREGDGVSADRRVDRIILRVTQRTQDRLRFAVHEAGAVHGIRRIRLAIGHGRVVDRHGERRGRDVGGGRLLRIGRVQSIARGEVGVQSHRQVHGDVRTHIRAGEAARNSQAGVGSVRVGEGAAGNRIGYRRQHDHPPRSGRGSVEGLYGGGSVVCLVVDGDAVDDHRQSGDGEPAGNRFEGIVGGRRAGDDGRNDIGAGRAVRGGGAGIGNASRYLRRRLAVLIAGDLAGVGRGHRAVADGERIGRDRKHRPVHGKRSRGVNDLIVLRAQPAERNRVSGRFHDPIGRIARVVGAGIDQRSRQNAVRRGGFARYEAAVTGLPGAGSHGGAVCHADGFGRNGKGRLGDGPVDFEGVRRQRIVAVIQRHAADRHRAGFGRILRVVDGRICLQSHRVTGHYAGRGLGGAAEAVFIRCDQAGGARRPVIGPGHAHAVQRGDGNGPPRHRQRAGRALVDRKAVIGRGKAGNVRLDRIGADGCLRRVLLRSGAACDGIARLAGDDGFVFGALETAVGDGKRRALAVDGGGAVDLYQDHALRDGSRGRLLASLRIQGIVARRISREHFRADRQLHGFIRSAGRCFKRARHAREGKAVCRQQAVEHRGGRIHDRIGRRIILLVRRRDAADGHGLFADGEDAGAVGDLIVVVDQEPGARGVQLVDSRVLRRDGMRASGCRAGVRARLEPLPVGEAVAGQVIFRQELLAAVIGERRAAGGYGDAPLRDHIVCRPDAARNEIIVRIVVYALRHADSRRIGTHVGLGTLHGEIDGIRKSVCADDRRRGNMGRPVVDKAQITPLDGKRILGHIGRKRHGEIGGENVVVVGRPRGFADHDDVRQRDGRGVGAVLAVQSRVEVQDIVIRIRADQADDRVIGVVGELVFVGPRGRDRTGDCPAGVVSLVEVQEIVRSLDRQRDRTDRHRAVTLRVIGIVAVVALNIIVYVVVRHGARLVHLDVGENGSVGRTGGGVVFSGKDGIRAVIDRVIRRLFHGDGDSVSLGVVGPGVIGRRRLDHRLADADRHRVGGDDRGAMVVLPADGDLAGIDIAAADLARGEGIGSGRRAADRRAVQIPLIPRDIVGGVAVRVGEGDRRQNGVRSGVRIAVFEARLFRGNRDGRLRHGQRRDQRDVARAARHREAVFRGGSQRRNAAEIRLQRVIADLSVGAVVFQHIRGGIPAQERIPCGGADGDGARGAVEEGAAADHGHARAAAVRGQGRGLHAEIAPARVIIVELHVIMRGKIVRQ